MVMHMLCREYLGVEKCAYTGEVQCNTSLPT